VEALISSPPPPGHCPASGVYIVHMAGEPPQRIPVVFYRTASGREAVRDWLRDLEDADRQAIGQDLMRVRYRWPVGMPLCRALGDGLWEVRTSLPGGRIARVIFCVPGGVTAKSK